MTVIEGITKTTCPKCDQEYLSALPLLALKAGCHRCTKCFGQVLRPQSPSVDEIITQPANKIPTSGGSSDLILSLIEEGRE